MVKDSTNTDRLNSYMDSDGRIAAYFTKETSTHLPGYQRHFFGDGLWHMATLTTLSDDPNGTQGHAMYLDGVMVAMQRADQLYAGKPYTCCYDVGCHACVASCLCGAMHVWRHAHIWGAMYVCEHACRVQQHHVMLLDVCSGCICFTCDGLQRLLICQLTSYA